MVSWKSSKAGRARLRHITVSNQIDNLRAREYRNLPGRKKSVSLLIDHCLSCWRPVVTFTKQARAAALALRRNDPKGMIL